MKAIFIDRGQIGPYAKTQKSFWNFLGYSVNIGPKRKIGIQMAKKKLPDILWYVT